MSAGDFADAAYRYSELGWALIRVEGKVPRGKGWQTTSPADPGYAAGQWAQWGDRFGMGVVLGPSGLAVLEYDREDARERFLELVGDSPTPIVRTGSGKHHAYFQAGRGVGKAVREGLELRAGEHQCVVPPSLHPDTGEPYAWERPPWEYPPPDLPSRVVEWFSAARAAAIPAVIEHPHRHESFVQVAASMRAKGANEAAVLHALRGLNAEQTGGLPKPDDELVRIARDAMGWRVGQKPRNQDNEPGFVWLTDVSMRSIEWLERPLWQTSAFQLLGAAKGMGKGTYLAGLSARVTKLGRKVVFVSSEDSAEIDLKPRLVAAGAVVERCALVTRDVKLPEDVDWLRTLAGSVGEVGLLVIDPVANHLGPRNSNQEAEVRHAIAPLNGLADDLKCLIVGVRHVGKDRSRGAIASILGSTAWVDTPRAVVMIAADDENEFVRHIQVVVGNRSLNGAGEAFRIEAVPVEGLKEPITLAVPLGQSSKNVEDLFEPRKEDRAKVAAERVQEVILEALATGEKSRDYLNASCVDELGVGPDTTYKSGLDPLRKVGLIRPRKDGFTGPWLWSLKDEVG